MGFKALNIHIIIANSRTRMPKNTKKPESFFWFVFGGFYKAGYVYMFYGEKDFDSKKQELMKTFGDKVRGKYVLTDDAEVNYKSVCKKLNDERAGEFVYFAGVSKVTDIIKGITGQRSLKNFGEPVKRTKKDTDGEKSSEDEKKPAKKSTKEPASDKNDEKKPTKKAAEKSEKKDDKKPTEKSEKKDDKKPAEKSEKKDDKKPAKKPAKAVDKKPADKPAEKKPAEKKKKELSEDEDDEEDSDLSKYDDISDTSESDDK